MRLILAAAALWTLAACAAAPEPANDRATVGLGESVLARVEGAAVQVIERTPAGALTPFEQRAAGHLGSGHYDWASGPTAAPMTAHPDDPPPAPVRANAVRIRFMAVPGRNETLLVIENGYDRAFVYRALITVRGRTEATDVCLVRPGLRGIEHWPYAIERIEIYEVTLQPWQDGDRVSCR